jgi:hypothetical protein
MAGMPESSLDAFLAAPLAPTRVLFVEDARGVMNGVISER